MNKTIFFIKNHILMNLPLFVAVTYKIICEGYESQYFDGILYIWTQYLVVIARFAVGNSRCEERAEYF